MNAINHYLHLRQIRCCSKVMIINWSTPSNSKIAIKVEISFISYSGMPRRDFLLCHPKMRLTERERT